MNEHVLDDSALQVLLSSEPGFEKMVDFNEEMAFEAGKLRPVTRKLGPSLGDRACLATAKVLNLPAVTTDRAWLKLRAKVKIRCVR